MQSSGVFRNGESQLFTLEQPADVSISSMFVFNLCIVQVIQGLSQSCVMHHVPLITWYDHYISTTIGYVYFLCRFCFYLMSSYQHHQASSAHRNMLTINLSSINLLKCTFSGYNIGQNSLLKTNSVLIFVCEIGANSQRYMCGYDDGTMRCIHVC